MIEDNFPARSRKTPAFWGYTCFTPEILDFLRKIQTDYHLSNVSFAQVLGVHCSTLKKWLDGRISSCSPENFKSILRLYHGEYDAKLREATHIDDFWKRVKEMYGENIRCQHALLELFREMGTLYRKIRSLPHLARSFVHSLRKFLFHSQEKTEVEPGIDPIGQLLMGKEISVLQKTGASCLSQNMEEGWGKHLHQHRLDVHLSLNALADLFEVDWTTVRKWERLQRCSLRGGNLAKIQIFLEGGIDSYALNHYHYLVALKEVQKLLPAFMKRLWEQAVKQLRRRLTQGRDAVAGLFQGLMRCLSELRQAVQLVLA